MNDQKRCLVFAAHPDDETNGVGGTLLRLAELDWRIRIIYATLPTDPKVHDARKRACIHVCDHVKAQERFWDLTDGKLKVTRQTRALTQAAYDGFDPHLILVMSGHDVHPDHRAMADLALGPALQRGVNIEVMLYELCSSGRHTQGDRPQTLGFIPTHFVDTTEVIEEVAQIQHYHDTEDPEAMVQGMRNVHRNRAREMHLPDGSYAEAFVRLTRVGPLQHRLWHLFKETPFLLPRPIGVDFLPETIGL